MTFGQRLRQLRELAGLSQNQLAKNAHVHRPLISLVESGKQQSVTLEVAQRLARALGVSLEYLAGPERQDESEEAHAAAPQAAPPQAPRQRPRKTAPVG